MRLALWQGQGVEGDLAGTVAEAWRVAGEARRAGAGLLVFPEGFLTGYHVPGLAAAGLAGVEDALREIGAAAREAGLGIVMGTHLAEGEVLRNAAVAFGPDGAELGRYAKRALFGGWEKETFAPGRGSLRFDCGGLRVGVLICYDVEFPELVRAEARAGADLVAVPTACMTPYEHIPLQMVPVRAMENQVFLGYANRCHSEAHLTFTGRSSICGPDGEVLCSAGEDPALLVADLDAARITEARGEFCYLDDLAGLS